MRVALPVTGTGHLDPRWGRAHLIAVATVAGGAVTEWHEHEVAWDHLHDEGGEGAHHARVARFLREQQVEAVVANHMGPGMTRMLTTMGLPTVLGAEGDARIALEAALAELGASA